MSIEDANRIYSNGFSARLAGKSLSDNPHLIGTADYECWLMGWEDQDEHLNSRDEALASIGWFGPVTLNKKEDRT